MWLGGMMKHLTNLAIAAGVFLFTKLYADIISFNSIEISGLNLVGHLLVMIFVIQWIAYIPAFIFNAIEVTFLAVDSFFNNLQATSSIEQTTSIGIYLLISFTNL